MASLLVVDDDPSILELVSLVLTQAGHRVTSATTGHGALAMAEETPFDLVVLDVLLPGVDGREVCRRLRRKGRVPILMLTALGEIHHKLQGFEAGADDYLAKPFEPSELAARVRALLKRAGADRTLEERSSEPLVVGPLTLDPDRVEVRTNQLRQTLPAKEFALLRTLAEDPGRLFSRDQLLLAAWGDNHSGADRTIDVYMNRIRTRLPEVDWGIRIVSVRGVGYRLEFKE